MMVGQEPAGSHWQLGPTPSTIGSGGFKVSSSTCFACAEVAVIVDQTSVLDQLNAGSCDTLRNLRMPDP